MKPLPHSLRWLQPAVPIPAAGLIVLLVAGSAGASIAASAAAPSVATAPASPPAASSPWGDWQTLRFEARQLLFFTGEVEMSRRTEGDRLILQTRTRASFLGAQLVATHTTSVMDARTGQAIEYWELSSRRGRHYVFGPDGYTVEKLRPPANGLEAPPQQWTVVPSARRFPRSGSVAAPGAPTPLAASGSPGAPAPLAASGSPGAPAPLAASGSLGAPTPLIASGSPAGPSPGSAPPLYDAYGMLLQLAREKLEKPGDEVVLTVATSHGPEPYRIRVTEARTSRREVEDLRTGNPLPQTSPRELRLRITPANPDPEDEGFMKMEGETEIWVEARTRTLLEIDGRIPRVPGRVEIHLAAVGR